MIKVDRHTTNVEFEPWRKYIGAEDMERLKKAAVADRFGVGGFNAMTVGQLTTVLAGDPRPLYRSGGRTLFDTLTVEAFGEFIDKLAETLKRLTVTPTPESIKLSSGVMPSEFTESVYLFCRSYFGLPSFEAADTLKVSEYLLARKDDYNKQIVDRNVANAMKGGRK